MTGKIIDIMNDKGIEYTLEEINFSSCYSIVMKSLNFDGYFAKVSNINAMTLIIEVKTAKESSSSKGTANCVDGEEIISVMTDVY